MATNPANAKTLNAIQRKTVQLEVPQGGNMKDFFEKDAAGNISIKHDQLKEILEKNALPQNKLDTQAVKVSVGVDV